MAAVALLSLPTLIAPGSSPGSDRAAGAAAPDDRISHASPAARTGKAALDASWPVLTDRPSPAAGDGPEPDGGPGSLAMDNRQLDLLLEQGFLDVLHPEGGLLRIDLLRLEKADTVRILHITSAGLRGVITECLGDYFATIATPAGVYTLERRNGHTQLASQQQLDLRNNPDARDYRHAPLA